jgi:glycosyltransferase involved in cell wall biosynthesis
MKIALFHPWIKSKGGAEKVVLEFLKNTKHDVEAYTWIYDRENTFDEFKKFKIKVIGPKFSQKLSRKHVLRGLFLPISIFSKIPLKKYDKFLISTGGVAEFITFRNYKKGQTYVYSHTPLREANKKIVKWNLENRHKNKFLSKQMYLFAVKLYRIFEKKAWKKLEVIMFNSELSQSRAKEHNLLGKQKIQVVHPPFDALNFKGSKTKSGNNFIYISRFNPPKRQDLLLEAWKKFVEKNPKYNLILIGDIDNKEYFKKLKKLRKKTKNVEIKLNVSNEELKKFISESYAGLFLGYQEDFGIVPLEIILAGKSLIAVDEGGYVSLIKNNSLFHKIKEKHDREIMIKEIGEELENFIKKKKKVKRNKKIEIKNFAKEIDKVLSS